jgi:hypothetical protein
MTGQHVAMPVTAQTRIRLADCGRTVARSGGQIVNSTVIGGAMLPHAPQFFTMPDTEDRETVGRVKAAAAAIGASLKALTPDLWIIISNDHAEQFFHLAAPPFTIHVGNEAKGAFAGRDFYWRVPSEVGFELVRQMYRQGFDPAFTSAAKIDYAIGIPLTHLGITDPVLRSTSTPICRRSRQWSDAMLLARRSPGSSPQWD